MKHGGGQNSLRRWSEIDVTGLAAVAALSALFYFAVLKPITDHRDSIIAQRRELRSRKTRLPPPHMPCKPSPNIWKKRES